MRDIRFLLSELDRILLEKNPVNYHRLLPPLPEDQIDSLLKKIDITDDNFKALYEWKNGSDEGPESAQIFPFQCGLTPLQEVVKTYERKYLDIDERMVIFLDTGDEFFLFNKEAGEDYGRIHLYSVPMLSIEPPFAYFDSLTAMLECTLEQYEKGALYYDAEHNFLDSDMSVSVPIYHKWNPVSNFYQS